MGNQHNKLEYQFGFRVLQVHENSPASKLNLKIFSDFVVDIINKPDNLNVERDFYKYIIANENQEIELLIFNIFEQNFRKVKILLTRNWEGADFLLGFKVRYESIDLAQKNLYRVIKVMNPQLQNQVVSHNYFFIGVNEFCFDDLEDLREKISFYKDCKLVFFDLETLSVKIIEFKYNRRTGFGMELGNGYIHDLKYLYNKKIEGLNQIKSFQFGEIEMNNREEKPNFADSEGQDLSAEQINFNN